MALDEVSAYESGDSGQLGCASGWLGECACVCVCIACVECRPSILHSVNGDWTRQRRKQKRIGCKQTEFVQSIKFIDAERRILNVNRFLCGLARLRVHACVCVRYAPLWCEANRTKSQT